MTKVTVSASQWRHLEESRTIIYGNLLAKGPQKGPVKVGIIGAGKRHVTELLLDQDAGQVRIGKGTFPIQPAWVEASRTIRDDAAKKIESRRRLFGDKIAANNDRFEMICVANATGLEPRIGLHAEPILRTLEIPEALCHKADGGILDRPGVLDTIYSLLTPEIPTMGGGVFVVVRCENAYSCEILNT